MRMSDWSSDVCSSDLHDVLARVPEIVGPELRMDDAAVETIGARKFGRMAARVIVIARAHEKAIAGEVDRLTVVPARLHRPARVRSRPRRRLDMIGRAHV